MFAGIFCLDTALRHVPACLPAGGMSQHVMLIVLASLQMADLSTHTANVWRTLADSSPQFVADHVLAVGLWLLFYAAECSGHDTAARAGNRSLRGQVALVPKLLVPLDFKGVAQAWLQSPYFNQPTGK